ncbi:carbohydrate sulfotransferase 10 isoform X2 [Procambarus clarkii]|uniref:carbohydrate sulfotransferase 10 isoform X2 n=1 Tax=Procambarus clarkii TaxID=6728 RepID=UPI003743D8D4
MLMKSFKTAILASVLTLLVYINVSLNLGEYKVLRNNETNVEKLVGEKVQDLSNNVSKAVTWTRDPEDNFPIAQKRSKPSQDVGLGLSKPTNMILERSLAASDPPGGRRDDPVFPNATNCSRRDYNSAIQNHRGPSNPTRDLYPCRVWRVVDPHHDPRWPDLVLPTNGSVLHTLTLHHHDPDIERLISEQMAVQKERVGRLTETCLRHPEAATRQYINLVWDVSRTPPLVYCPIYKVASTTWMVYFLRLAHVNDNNAALHKYKSRSRDRKKYMPRFGGGHRRVFEEYKAPKTAQKKSEVFRQSLRFIVVRHPFARLLSAYRDKIENPKPKPFVPYFLDLQRAIMLKYRVANTNVNSTSPTFSEFVNYVIDSTENLKTAKQWYEEVVCWTPYWVQCGVCSSDYQLVIKLETMVADEQFLAHVADLKEIQNVHEWRNLKRDQASTAVLPDYFKSLTKRQIWLLYDRFKLDFDLFGYSIDEYLDYVMQ